ncbi:replication associated protein [Chicken virus mg4_280]|nr:replication associated protein [Chicken virus mg4_280]
MATKVWLRKTPGNTKSRSLQLTLNQVDRYPELLENLKSYKSLRYLLSAREIAPSTGHEHIHIYVMFDNPIKLSIKKTCGAHIEHCRGSPKQNIDYIRKDGDILDEIGEVPHQGCRTIDELMEMSRGEVQPNYLKIYDQEFERRREEEEFENMLNEIRNDDLKAPEVVYFTGAPGVGKTYSAYLYAAKEYSNEQIGKITFNNGFAHIVKPKAECFVVEEFRPSEIKAAKLLEFMDKYGAAVNTKGGFVYLRPKTIIFASVFDPRTLYSAEENNEQFMRRINKFIDIFDDQTLLKKY